MKILKSSIEEASAENNELNNAEVLTYSCFMGICIMELFIMVSIYFNFNLEIDMYHQSRNYN